MQKSREKLQFSKMFYRFDRTVLVSSSTPLNALKKYSEIKRVRMHWKAFAYTSSLGLPMPLKLARKNRKGAATGNDAGQVVL